MDLLKIGGLVLIIFSFNVKCQLSLSASSVDPITAIVNVMNTASVPITECSYQCRNLDGIWVECQCPGRTCNTMCLGETITNLVPGVRNDIVLNRKLEDNKWESYSVSVVQPYIDYSVQLREVHKTNATIIVTPRTPSGFVSTSCSITISKSSEQDFKEAQCLGSCSPCTTVTIINLDPSTEYQTRVLPNFARKPEFIELETSSYSFALEEVQVNENNATIRIVRGDAPSDAICDLWIRRTSQESNDWKRPYCDNRECPNNCDELIVITQLVAREEYELALNSSISSDPVTITFKTGNVEYSGSVIELGPTWIVVQISRLDGSEVKDDACHYFLNSIRFGRTRARCGGQECPDDCATPVNITGLVPGVPYRLIIVPWKHGSFFYVDFFTEDVVFRVKELLIFPTKVSLSLNASHEPRGVCSYRLLDDTNRYTQLVCERRPCPNDCKTINITRLSPNKNYRLEVHSSYSSIVGILSFTTNKVVYSLTQLTPSSTSVSLNLKGNVDYRDNVLEDCSMILQHSTGEKIRLTSCFFPPCGYQCSDNNYTIVNLQAGSPYIFYLNSTLTDYEHHFGVYTVEADLRLLQEDAELTTISLGVFSNETDAGGICSVALENASGQSLTPTCGSSICGANCQGFTLTNLEPSSEYKITLKSNSVKTPVSVDGFTKYPAPRINKTEITGKQAIRVTWEYDFQKIKDYIFSAVVRETESNKLLFANAYFPPTTTANLDPLPPATNMTISVCTSPVKADHLSSCDTVDGYIEVLNPDPLGPVSILKVSTTIVDISLPPITPFQGNVWKCYIYGVYLLNQQSFSSVKIPSPKDIPSGARYFVSHGATGILHADIDGESCRKLSIFKFGDNLVYNNIKNTGVRRDNYFTVLYRTCINKNVCSDSSLPIPVYISGTSPGAYGILAISLLILIITVSYILYIRFSKNYSIKTKVITSDINSTIQGIEQTPDYHRTSQSVSII